MKKLIAALILILSFQMARSQSTTTQLAWEYYNQREYEKAAPLFLKMYEENSVATYLTYYINCLLQVPDYETAVKAVKKAIRTSKDINLNIQLGYIYEVSGDQTKADAAYQEPIRAFPSTPAGIINLGNSYSSFAKYTYAEMVYEMGRKVLNNPNEFRLELANVFFAQRRFPEMLNEYFSLLLADPRYIPTVQVMIKNALNNDIDETLIQLTRDKTYSYIQEFPGLPTFYEMLIWVLMEEKKFGEAVDQAIALDRRNQAAPDKVLLVARAAADAGDTDAAVTAYSYVISKGASDPARIPVYHQARVEYLMARSEKLTAQPGTSQADWLQLAGEFRQTITDIGKESVSDPIYIGLAHILAFQLSDYDQALSTIEVALALPGKSPTYRSDCLLEKADIYLSSGDPWEASLVYSMVDMENPDNPQGAEARFRKTQLSWFTGNYQWALAQLDVLKGSTSKPNANDALELSILIRENISETDSSQTILLRLAEADYLIFRHQNDSALLILDSIIQHAPDDPSVDDCLFRKANILIGQKRLDEGMDILGTIIEKFRYEYWGHKALYQLACIYQDQLNNQEKALAMFEEFIRDFPSSFYFLDARNRLKALKSKST